MASHTRKSTKSSVFLVSRNWQFAFVAMVVLAWLAGVATTFIWASTGYTSAGTWTYQLTQAGLPLLWFLGALWLTWSRYLSRLHKLFAASFVAVVGFGVFQMLSSLENTLRFRFYPPHYTANDHSLLTAFGHEWLMMGIGLTMFLAFVAWKKYGFKRR